MDALNCIFTRRSTRAFSTVPVEFDKLTTVLDAGNHAPSAGNLQNWKFILVVDKQKLQGFYTYCMQQECFRSAQAGIVVISQQDVMEDHYGLRGERLYSIQNCAAATENMLLAAHALGLGAVWVGAFDEEKLAHQLDIPGSCRIQAIVLLGYPAESPEVKNEKELHYQVFFERYGNKYETIHRTTWDWRDEWERRVRKGKPVLERIGKDLGNAARSCKDAFKGDNK